MTSMFLRREQIPLFVLIAGTFHLFLLFLVVFTVMLFRYLISPRRCILEGNEEKYHV